MQHRTTWKEHVTWDYIQRQEGKQVSEGANKNSRHLENSQSKEMEVVMPHWQTIRKHGQ